MKSNMWLMNQISTHPCNAEENLLDFGSFVCSILIDQHDMHVDHLLESSVEFQNLGRLEAMHA